MREQKMEQFGQFITNHWQLWLAFSVLLILVLINELLTKRTKDLSPQALIDLINTEQAVVIDLRDKEVFKNGHIIHSIQASPQDFELAKMNKYKNKPLVLVCARGLQSPPIAAKIRAQGYQPLVLSGGIAAWQNAGLPLIKGK